MARTKGADEYHPRTIWHRQEFQDHAGHHAIRLCLAPENIDPFTRQILKDEPPYYFQIYTTVPLEHGAEAVTDWLDFTPERNGYGLLIYDVYEPLPDPFECVEHSRREVRHRIARWRNQTTPTEPWCSDLIPKTPRSQHDKRRDGFLIMVTDKPPRGRGDRKAGSPLLATFNRMPQQLPIELDRLSDYPATLVHEQPNPVSPERLDMRFWRQQATSALPGDLYILYRTSIVPHHERHDGTLLDYGLDDEVPGTDVDVASGTDVSISESLERLRLSSGFTAQTKEDGSLVIQTEASAEPLVRYRVYIPFLLKDEGLSSLEQVARAFTAAVTQEYSTTPVHFHFIVPQHATLASILEADRALAQSANEPTLGTLVSYQGQEERLCPWFAQDRPLMFMNIRPTFAIVLEGPDFVQNARVVYLIGSMDRYCPDESYVETEIRRPVSWDATVQRLVMPLLSGS